MAILIDGYNLLHEAGILGRHIGPGTLERARIALFNFLAASLTDAERADTVVVFDAPTGLSGLPREQFHHGLQVRYAVGYADADDLLEELIRADSSPRKLVVVSSDHQIQRAARRRRATAVDSEPWYADLCRRRRARDLAEPAPEEKPVPPDVEAEAEYWLKAFGQIDAEAESTDLFPPGYAEDLLADEEEDGK
jgi:predicted RNA-binding protein with PIN domain